MADVIKAARAGDDLIVRQWVTDCLRERVMWSALKQPAGLDGDGLVIAAGFVEMMAEKVSQSPPVWTSSIHQASEPIYLAAMAMALPRTRALCELAGPEPLRRRGVFAPPDYLNVA